jgi:1-acyl-sn-glycerol-3-phosphate acyltransferase
MPDCAGLPFCNGEAQRRLTINSASSSTVAEARAHFGAKVGVGPWPMADAFEALARRFVGSIVLANSESLTTVRERGAIFLGNHQTAVESLTFSYLVSGLLRMPVPTLDPAYDPSPWIGTLLGFALAYPGVGDLGFTLPEAAALPALLAILGRASLLVHVEGRRETSADHKVTELAGAILEAAHAARVPIVPVRFCRGLPIRPAPERMDLPIGVGRQDIWIGCPIRTDALMALGDHERKERILSALNALGKEHDRPGPPDLLFATKMAAWAAQTGATRIDAALLLALAELPAPSPLTRRILDGVRQRRLEVGHGHVEAWLAVLARRLYGSSGPAIVG